MAAVLIIASTAIADKYEYREEGDKDGYTDETVAIVDGSGLNISRQDYVVKITNLPEVIEEMRDMCADVLEIRVTTPIKIISIKRGHNDKDDDD